MALDGATSFDFDGLGDGVNLAASLQTELGGGRALSFPSFPELGGETHLVPTGLEAYLLDDQDTTNLTVNPKTDPFLNWGVDTSFDPVMAGTEAPVLNAGRPDDASSSDVLLGVCASLVATVESLEAENQALKARLQEAYLIASYAKAQLEKQKADIARFRERLDRHEQDKTSHRKENEGPHAIVHAYDATQEATSQGQDSTPPSLEGSLSSSAEDGDGELRRSGRKRRATHRLGFSSSPTKL